MGEKGYCKIWPRVLASFTAGHSRALREPAEVGAGTWRASNKKRGIIARAASAVAEVRDLSRLCNLWHVLARWVMICTANLGTDFCS